MAAGIFWKELNEAADDLSARSEVPVKELGSKLSGIVKNASIAHNASPFISLDAVSEKTRAIISSKKSETDAQIKESLDSQLNRDRDFLADLANCIVRLTDTDDDQEELEEDQELEEERGTHQQPPLAAAAEEYMKVVRAQARARVKNRTLSLTSRSGQISEWLGKRSLDDARLRALGESLQIQSNMRKFLNPMTRYLRGIPSRYRRYRRFRQTEGKWYESDGFAQNEISPLETDAILLSILRSATSLLHDNRILQNIDDQRYSFLKGILDISRNQVVVDEATDFSPLQLACMDAVSNPKIQSLFLCGDFNQRITREGCRSASEMKWAIPKVDIRPIKIAYRHSRQLDDLAKEIVRLCENDPSEAVLPEHVDNEGVPAVLGTGLADNEAIAGWLALRIAEIEQFTGESSTIAVLVNSEEDVGPMAESLGKALLSQNVKVAACHKGQAVGSDNDVRIFDVQHIKGLEFEAVFFVGIDRLVEAKPTLFDKYLYVGATRAATYLGLTCAGAHLPTKIAALEESLEKSFAHG